MSHAWSGLGGGDVGSPNLHVGGVSLLQLAASSALHFAFAASASAYHCAHDRMATTPPTTVSNVAAPYAQPAPSTAIDGSDHASMHFGPLPGVVPPDPRSGGSSSVCSLPTPNEVVLYEAPFVVPVADGFQRARSKRIVVNSSTCAAEKCPVLVPSTICRIVAPDPSSIISRVCPGVPGTDLNHASCTPRTGVPSAR